MSTAENKIILTTRIMVPKTTSYGFMETYLVTEYWSDGTVTTRTELGMVHLISKLDTY